jgi:ubiquinone/menaquinone biosynthesis C-methylase UbiE
MPLPDSSFDVVLCQIGPQFMPNKLKALQEFRLVGKASGDQRAALTNDIRARWRAFVVGGVLTLDVEMTTVSGR